MSDKNKQEEVRGYMAIYHDIEEMNYGPMLGMPAKWRVFLCIRHKLLRDGLCEKHIGTSFIMEKTELTKSQIKSAIKSLHSDGLIINIQNSRQLPNGKLVYAENSYALNPVKFGDLYNWYKNNPTVRVYEGGKGKSFSQKGPVPNVAPVPVSDLAPGGDINLAPGKTLKLSELLDISRSKNPSSNNPDTKNPISNDLTFSGKKKKSAEEHDRIVKEQLELMKAGKL